MYNSPVGRGAAGPASAGNDVQGELEGMEARYVMGRFVVYNGNRIVWTRSSVVGLLVFFRLLCEMSISFIGSQAYIDSNI